MGQSRGRRRRDETPRSIQENIESAKERKKHGKWGHKITVKVDTRRKNASHELPQRAIMSVMLNSIGFFQLSITESILE